MLRALSTRGGTYGYERLKDDPTVGLLENKLKRATSVPASRIFCQELTPEFTFKETPKPQPQAKTVKKARKIHPFFSLFDSSRKKKTTTKLEVARYLEYIKEGGLWDAKSNKPVIHYR